MRKVKYFADAATKKAASDALQVQDAVNGVAIVKSLDRNLESMRSQSKVATFDSSSNNWKEHQLDGDTTNQHPVMVLFVDKLASLAGVQSIGNDMYTSAHQACQQLSQGDGVETEVRRL